MWLECSEEGGELEERRAERGGAEDACTFSLDGGEGTSAFPLSEVGAMEGSEQRRYRPAQTREYTGTLLRLQECQAGSERTG